MSCVPFPMRCSWAGDGEDDGLCAPRPSLGFGMTIAFGVLLKDCSEPRRKDMQSDTLVPQFDAGDQGADDATLFM